MGMGTKIKYGDNMCGMGGDWDSFTGMGWDGVMSLSPCQSLTEKIIHGVASVFIIFINY